MLDEGLPLQSWQPQLKKAKVDAGRIWAEKDKRKAKWRGWAYEPVDAMTSSEYQRLVEREMARMG